MTQCCMGQDCPSVLLYMMHSNIYIIIWILGKIYNLCMYVCIYIYYIYICQDGGAVGFVDFTKLLFALSSLAQPLKQ